MMWSNGIINIIEHFQSDSWNQFTELLIKNTSQSSNKMGEESEGEIEMIWSLAGNSKILKIVLIKVREPNGFIKSRTVLWYLTFVGFAVNYMIRINVNIAVVAMIDGTYKKSSMNTVITSECLDTNLINIDTKNWSQTVSHRVLTPLVEERKLPSIERRFLDYFEVFYWVYQSIKVIRIMLIHKKFLI